MKKLLRFGFEVFSRWRQDWVCFAVF